MANRHFYLRLNCTYEGPENNIDDLTIESKNDSGWEQLDLNVKSPRILIIYQWIIFLPASLYEN